MSDNHAAIDSQIEQYEDRISAAGYDPDNPPATEKVVEDKPSIFDESRESELRSSLGKIYDRNQAASEKAEEAKIVPSITAGDSTTTAFEKTYDWLHASPQERATQRDASQLVETVRTNAAKFGAERHRGHEGRDGVGAGPGQGCPFRTRASHGGDQAKLPRSSTARSRRPLCGD